MLSTYSVLMMLLLGTGSLVGISSMYTPANVETQPQPPPNTRGLVTQKEFQSTSQILNDALLLDRLFPQIIKRIDGNTLLQKIDGKLLAQKVFPYLDVNVVLTQRPGQIGNIKVGALSPTGGAAWGKAGCPPGETAVSAGFTHEAKGDVSVFSLRKNDPNSNMWDITSSFDDTGRVLTYAQCLTVELALKDVQQPQQPQPQQPSQPPGGPPLQPPPEFGK